MSLVCPDIIARIDAGACKAIVQYCERTSAALDAEPVNALSNAAFLIAAWGVWRLQGDEQRPLARLLPVLIALVGIGSFVFHTVSTRWAEWADVVPILAFMLVYFWLFLTQFFAWPITAKTAAVATLVGSTLAIEAMVPASVLWGGALYIPVVLAMLACGGALVRLQPMAGAAFFAAALLFLISFTARTLDMPLCQSLGTGIGTHFIWHLANAAVLYLLAHTLIVYASRPRPSSGPAHAA